MIFIFTGESGAEYGYEDGWDTEGVFSYTGEGQRGDMEFVRGNRAIRDHLVDGKDLHLFKSLGKSKGYRYLGQFACTSWEERMAPDADQSLRKAIVFHLIAADDDDVVQPAVEVEGREATGTTDLESLRKAAFEASQPSLSASRSQARSSYYQRSKAVRDYVLARAAGTCECCDKPAPFSRSNGAPYLEPHHTRRVSDGGPDHPRWVAGICPNCHREIHHGANGEALDRQLIAYLGELEGGNDGTTSEGREFDPQSNTCPECGQTFGGSGWGGIDAHWKAQHESIMSYSEAWPLIKAGKKPSEWVKR